MIDVSKIKQYNLASLLYIVSYKVIYKVYLRLFRFFVPSEWSIKKGKRGVLPEQTFARFFSLCDSNREQIIEEADQILAGRILLFGTGYEIDSANGWLSDPVSQKEWDKNCFFVSAPVKQEGLGDVKYVLELNKFNHLVRVALAYHYTHDDKYIDYINTSITGYRKTIKPYRSVCQRIVMDAGFRIINLIQVMMLCSDSKQFEEHCSPLINGIIYDQVNAIRRFHTARWFKTGNGNNHVTGEMVGAIAGMLWLESCGIKIRGRYSHYMRYLLEVLDRTIAPSGAYLEQSDNYARVVCEFLIFFDLLVEMIPSSKLNLAVYKENKYTERLRQYVTDISYHDQLPNNGDNDDARVLIAWRPQQENVRYILNDCKKSKKSYLDGSSWAYSSNDDNDVYLFSRVGKFAYFKEATRIHSHNDLLSLVIGIKEQMVFVDKGCYLYNQGADILLNDRAYGSHNTASLEGQEIDDIQKNGSYLNYPHSECSLSESKEDGCRFEGTLSYYGIKQIRRIDYNAGVITIRDSFSGNDIDGKAGKIKYLLHHTFDAVVNNKVVDIKGNGIDLQLTVENVNEIKLEKVFYAPAFARREETIAIVGIFQLDTNKEYRTKITIK